MKKRARSRPRKIRATTDCNRDGGAHFLVLGGWLDGKNTYLHFDHRCNMGVDSLSGKPLYRLAKAIVQEFEREEE